MTDDSLIDEMRMAIRGDRERAEQRRNREPRSAQAQSESSPPALLDEAGEPGVDAELPARGRVAWSLRLRRRRGR